MAKTRHTPGPGRRVPTEAANPGLLCAIVGLWLLLTAVDASSVGLAVLALAVVAAGAYTAGRRGR